MAACAAGAVACRLFSAPRARSSSGRQSRGSAPASVGTVMVSCGAARSHSARQAAASSWAAYKTEGCRMSAASTASSM